MRLDQKEKAIDVKSISTGSLNLGIVIAAVVAERVSY
jgi:hypothetical protein